MQRTGCSAALSKGTLPTAAAAAANGARHDSGVEHGKGLRLGPGDTRTVDVVVIGSGIGGLTCGGLLARYGEDVLVCESHTIPGGCAHGFEVNGFRFDSGPSLFSGLSSRGMQANPLAQALEALGESVPCVEYDGWMCFLPEGKVLSKIGPEDFCQMLDRFAGSDAVVEWKRLLATIEPLSGAAMVLPPVALRADIGVARTALLRYGPQLLKTFAAAGPAAALGASKLTGPFKALVDAAGVRSPFLRNWLDLIAFLLGGMKTDGLMAAEMIYMFSEWYKPGAVLEYPLGGVDAIVAALVRGLERHGGQLALGTHVEEIILEDGRAAGVRLRSGGVVRARKAVVSNASTWDTMRLLPDSLVVPREWRQQCTATPQCESFMHLHIGFDRQGLDPDLGIHHIVVNDWEAGVDAPLNAVLVSVPSVLDPSLAPEGKHVLHAYTPGTEPCELWAGLDRRSPEYKKLKEERSEVLWRAAELVLGPGFKRDKCDVALVGTPVTHARFLRRDRGTYGPAIVAGQGSFPGPKTPVPSLYCCGDSTFPGIGVPAVAASGLVAANTLTSVSKHEELLEAVGL